MISRETNIVYFVPEPLPSHRPDVEVLFNKELSGQGIKTHIFGYRNLDSDVLPLEGTTCVDSNSKISGFMYLVSSIRTFFLYRDKVSLFQVRDMVWIGLVVAILCRLMNKPFFYWMSFLMAESRIDRARNSKENINPIKRPLLLIKGLIEQWVLYKFVVPMSSHLIVQSQEMEKYVNTKVNKRCEISSLPMGVDESSLRSHVNIQKLAHPHLGCRPTIGYIGTLDRLREMEVVIEALAIAKKKIPELGLLFIGDTDIPEDREFLESEAKRLGVSDSFCITGWQSKSDAWSYLLNTDIAISHIPRNRIFDVSSPTKPLEYLALKIPFIANDSPDQALVINEALCGVLVSGSAQEYAREIVNFYGGTVDETVLQNGKDYIFSQRSYRKLAADLHKVYKGYICV